MLKKILFLYILILVIHPIIVSEILGLFSQSKIHLSFGILVYYNNLVLFIFSIFVCFAWNIKNNILVYLCFILFIIFTIIMWQNAIFINPFKSMMVLTCSFIFYIISNIVSKQ